MGFFQARVLEWGAIAFPALCLYIYKSTTNLNLLFALDVDWRMLNRKELLELSEVKQILKIQY